MSRDHRGGATNSEVKRLMLDHAFGSADAVWFHVGPGNLWSRRAVEKLGARLDRVAQRGGRETACYRLGRQEFMAARSRIIEAAGKR